MTDKTIAALSAATDIADTDLLELDTGVVSLKGAFSLLRSKLYARGINTQTNDYTLVLGDQILAVQMNKASAVNLTVPQNSSVAFPVGTVIPVRSIGAGLTTIVAGAGATVRTPPGFSLVLAGQYATSFLVKVATNEWFVAPLGLLRTSLPALSMSGNLNLADFELSRPLFVDTADKITAHGAMGSTETFDHAASDAHSGTLDADCTATLSNPSPTGTRCYFFLSITGNGTHKMIFPGSVSFGDLPTPGIIPNGAVVTYMLVTDDEGTSYIGSYQISSLTPVNAYTASHTLALVDRDAIAKMNHATNAMNLTFPQNSDVAIPVGASGEIWMYDAGVVTLVQGTGATLKYDDTNFTLVMAAKGSTVTWTKTGTNEFLVRGGLTLA